MQRRRLGAITAREDGHIASGIAEFARKFFHHGRWLPVPPTVRLPMAMTCMPSVVSRRMRAL